jgi:hypothetical protein
MIMMVRLLVNNHMLRFMMLRLAHDDTVMIVMPIMILTPNARRPNHQYRQ